MSLRARILALVLLATLLPAAVTVWLAIEEREEQVRSSQQDLIALARQARQSLESALSAAGPILTNLGQEPVLTRGSSEECSAFLARVHAALPQYSGVSVLLPDGTVRCSSSGGGNAPSMADRAYFQAARAGTVTVYEPLIGRLTGRAVVQIAQPVRDAAGALRFVLVAPYDLARLGDSLAKIPAPGSIMMHAWSADGRLLLRLPDDGSGGLVGERHAEAPIARFALAPGDAPQSAELPGLRGGQRVWARARSPLAGLTLTFGVMKTDLTAHAERELRNSLAAVAAIALATLALAWVLAERGIRRPIARIEDAVARFRAGDFAARIGAPYARGELGVLMRALDATAERLAQLNAELRQHAAESASGMAEMRERFELFMRHLPALAVIRDADGRIVYANEALREVNGIAPGDAIGRTGVELFGAEVAALFLAQDAEVLAAGVPRHFQYARSVQGKPKLHEAWKFPLPGRAGAPVLVGALVFDVTERERAAALLAESDRMKSAFLASMSHELKTPLAVILGYVEQLLSEDGSLSPAQRAGLEEIGASGRQMLAMVNDILDLARIEAGRLELRIENSDVALLLETCVAAQRAEAQAKNIALACDCPADLGTAPLDARRVRQMLDQLLTNALKFTLAGGRIACGARRIERDGREVLEIAVSDSGPGIPKEEQAKLFQPFVQLDRALSRKHGGTGLGLALVKKLAELHGGAAGVASEPGSGSTFYLWLPTKGKQ